MKRILTIICFLSITQTGFAADLIKPFSKSILVCNESATGTDLKLKVETTYTQFKFNGIGETREPTNRTIVIDYNGKKAISQIDTPPVNQDISWSDFRSVEFLKDDIITSDGTEYLDEETLHVKGNKFPAQLLRLKATVPSAQRITTNFGHTVSHYSINLVV